MEKRTEALEHLVDRRREERLAKMKEQLKILGVSEDDLDFISEEVRSALAPEECS